MRQEGIDMWLVICRENNEDPVYFSLVPFTLLYASRTSMLVFFDRGAEGIERMTVSRHRRALQAVWDPTGSISGRASARSSRSAAEEDRHRSDTFNYGDG
jgi:hypothetical protein